MPLKVGLTGGIASGKTTVSELFKQLGVPIIDADVIAHQIVQPPSPVLVLLAETFGQAILQADGQLNRAYLRDLVFQQPEQKQKLEAIMHPRIRAEMLMQVAQIKTPYCILSIPLLLETQQMQLVDKILVVDCPAELQRERLARRSGLDENMISAILAAQASRQQRQAIATEMVDNSLTIETLTKKIYQLHELYLKIAHQIKTTALS